MRSLIGTVPDDWSQVRLDRLCDLQAGPSGARLRTADRVATGVPVVSSRNLRNGLVIGSEPGCVANDVADRLERYRLHPGDILCTRTGELGQRGRVTDGQAGWLYATALLRLRPTEMIRAEYLTYYLALPMVREWIIRRASGTVVPAISSRSFATLPVVVPPLATQAEIVDVLATLDEQVAIHEQVSESSALLRDTLAPLLLTGAVAARRW